MKEQKKNKNKYEEVNEEKDEDIFTLIKRHKYKEIDERLKDKNMDYNLKDYNGLYLIHYFIMYNEVKYVRELLKKNCKIDYINNIGKTILFDAIYNGYFEIMEELINYDYIGISIVDLFDKDDNTSLFYFVDLISKIKNENKKNENDDNRDNNKKIIEKYYRTIDLYFEKFTHHNKKNKNGLCVLHYAIYKDVEYISNKLIRSNNQNVNIMNDYGETPLHIACNYSRINTVIELLKNSKIELNISDIDNQITPLMYVSTLNNIELTKLITNNDKIDLYMQDNYGDTALHMAILENNVNIANLLIDLYVKDIENKHNIKDINMMIEKINIFNVNGMSIFHLIYNKYENYYDIEKYNIHKILKYAYINIQDIYGCTILYYIIKKGLWYYYRDILKEKKQNIFIKTGKGETIYDVILMDVHKNKIFDIVIDSYYNHIIKNKDRNDYEYELKWENECARNNDEKGCKENIKEMIMEKKQSYPIKKKKIIVDIKKYENEMINFTTFMGVQIDILSGLLFLEKSIDTVYTTLHNKNIVNNQDVELFYSKMGYIKNYIDFYNIEILWLYQQLFLPEGFENLIEQFKKSNKRILVIPIGIELSNGAHTNILIYDKKTNIVERFEPNGYSAPSKFYYNDVLLDELLFNVFKLHFNDIIYNKPKDYLPKIGFQSYENVEHFQNKKIGDPSGFCACWCFWYAFYKIMYIDIPSKKIVKILLNNIKYSNISFKNLIRNFSKDLTDIRDNILNQANMDINDYVNDKYDMSNIDKIVLIIKNQL